MENQAEALGELSRPSLAALGNRAFAGPVFLRGIDATELSVSDFHPCVVVIGRGKPQDQAYLRIAKPGISVACGGVGSGLRAVVEDKIGWDGLSLDQLLDRFLFRQGGRRKRAPNQKNEKNENSNPASDPARSSLRPVRTDDLVDALMGHAQSFSDLSKRDSGTMELFDLVMVIAPFLVGVLERLLIHLAEFADAFDLVHIP